MLIQRFRNIFTGGSSHDLNPSANPTQEVSERGGDHSLSTESETEDNLSEDPARRTRIGGSRDSPEQFIRRMRSIRQNRRISRQMGGNSVYSSSLELSEQGSGLPPLNGRTRHLRLSSDDGSERRFRRPRSRNNSGESLSPLNDPLRDPHDNLPSVV